MKKDVSGLTGKDDPEWSIIVNLVLSDINRDINAVCSGPLDTPFADTNRDEFNNENDVGKDIEYDDASYGEQERESERFFENIGKRKNAADTCADKVVKNAQNKKLFVAKPREKRSVARSQLKAISQFAAGVSRLADGNARKMAIFVGVSKRRRRKKARTPKIHGRAFRKYDESQSQHHSKPIRSSIFISPSEFSPSLHSSAPLFSLVN